MTNIDWFAKLFIDVQDGRAHGHYEIDRRALELMDDPNALANLGVALTLMCPEDTIFRTYESVVDGKLIIAWRPLTTEEAVRVAIENSIGEYGCNCYGPQETQIETIYQSVIKVINKGK